MWRKEEECSWLTVESYREEKNPLMPSEEQFWHLFTFYGKSRFHSFRIRPSPLVSTSAKKRTCKLLHRLQHP